MEIGAHFLDPAGGPKFEVTPMVFPPPWLLACQEVRCTSAVSRRLPGPGSYLLIRRWKLGYHPHIAVDQHWTGWWQIEWGRWRKWKGWVQEPNPEEHLFWAGLWGRHPDQISHIGPSETGRTRATLKHCHRHHTLSEVELVKSSDRWCRRQRWDQVTREVWIPLGRPTT